MTTEFTITPDAEQLAELTRKLEYYGANTDEVLRVAINSTANRARSSTAMPGKGASQRIRATYNIKAVATDLGTTPVKYINDRLKVYRANRASLIGKVYAYKRGILLSHFRLDKGVPPTPDSGASVNVRLDTGTQTVGRIPETISKPFYIRARSNDQILLVGRRGTPGPRGGTLREARTLSVSQIFNRLRVEMLTEVKEEFTRQQVSAARYLLQKLGIPMEDPGDE
jgi:hypothetical protein